MTDKILGSRLIKRKRVTATRIVDLTLMADSICIACYETIDRTEDNIGHCLVEYHTDSWDKARQTFAIAITKKQPAGYLKGLIK